MTHDELLTRINIVGDTSLDAALRAVVELHKPQDITIPNGEWGSNCIECDGWVYPCQTIQTIEEELA